MTQWRVDAEERERAIEEALCAYPRAFGRSPGWDGVKVIETRFEPTPGEQPNIRAQVRAGGGVNRPGFPGDSVT
jgi:hypothetical protein